MEMLKTGGGVYTPKLTTLDEKILCLLKDNYFSIENEFDSNNENTTVDMTVSNVQTDCLYQDENIPSTSYSIDEHDYFELAQPDTVNIVNEENKLDESCEPPGKKSKQESKGNKEKCVTTNIMTKKRTVLDLKMNVLKTMHENEIENLKGRKLENEIKGIIKEKEILDLKIKQLEYSRLCSSL